MKKIVQLSICLVLAAMMMTGCSKNNPKDVAYTWLTSFNHMDFETAKPLSTADTKVLLSELEQMTDKVSDSNKKDLKKIVITVKNVQANGDKATASYATSDNPGKEQTINLVKQDGKWLVQFSKIDLMGGMPQKDELPAETEAPADSSAEAAPVSSTDSTKH